MCDFFAFRLAVEEQDAFSASALPLRTPQYSLGGGGVGGRKEKSVDCIVLVQSGLDVDCHSLLPTQTSLSVCPVCVDDVGIIYAHGCDQGEEAMREGVVVCYGVRGRLVDRVNVGVFMMRSIFNICVKVSVCMSCVLCFIHVVFVSCVLRCSHNSKRQ